MEKKYIQVFLNEKNIKKESVSETADGKKIKRVCVSFPKLGLCWLNRQQTVAYNPTKKDGTKSSNKELKITLSADAEYEFYTKNKETKSNETIIKTGQDIREFYKNLWVESKNADAKDKKVFVSTNEIVKELKKEPVADALKNNTNEQNVEKHNNNLSQ